MKKYGTADVKSLYRNRKRCLFVLYSILSFDTNY